MRREGVVFEEGDAAAHIVPSGMNRKSAVESRNLLGKYDIDVDIAANGVPLGHPRPHNLTHTKDFNDRVNVRLHNVERKMLNNKRGGKAIRKALIRKLRNIGREVMGGNYEV